MPPLPIVRECPQTQDFWIFLITMPLCAAVPFTKKAITDGGGTTTYSKAIRDVFRKKRYYVGKIPTWADPPPPLQYGNAHVKNTVFFPGEIFF